MSNSRRERGSRPGSTGLAIGLMGLVLAGCGDTAGTPADASSDGGADAGSGSAPCLPGSARSLDCRPEAPRGTPLDDCPSGELGEGDICVPLAPRLVDWTCPEGWEAVPALDDETAGAARLTGVEQFTVCQPPPAPEDCPAGSMAQVGQAACVRQGPACPDGDWADEAVLRARVAGFEGTVRYVRPAADAGGDGSRGDPYATVAAALDAAAPGDILALAAGDYTETVDLDRAVALVGACTEGTRFVPSPGPSPTLELSGAGGIWVSDLSLLGERPGLAVDRTAGTVDLAALYLHVDSAGDGVSIKYATGLVRLSDVRMDGEQSRCLYALESPIEVTRSAFQDCREAGIEVDGAAAEATLTDVRVVGTRAPRASPVYDAGLRLGEGVQVHAVRVASLDNETFGVFATEAGTFLEAEDLLVADTGARAADGAVGWGLAFGSGASGRITRGRILRNHGFGVIVGDAGSLELTDCLVVDSLAEPVDGSFGRGLEVEGAQATVARSVFLRNRDSSIFAALDGAELQLTDVLVARTGAEEASGGYGRNLQLAFQAHGTVERAAFWSGREVGVVIKEGASAELTDVRIDATQPQLSNGQWGSGLSMTGERLVLRRAALRGNHHLGIFVAGPDAVADLSDVLISDMQPDATGPGAGFAARDQATVTAERMGMFRTSPGLLVVNQATATMSDVRITGAGPAALDPYVMVSLAVAAAGQLTAERLSIQGGATAGVVTVDPGSLANLHELAVSDVEATSDAGGFGMVVDLEGHIQVDGFLITGSALAGLQVSLGGTIAAARGAITQNAIGINVQDADFNPGAAFDGVLTWDNESDLDYSALPIPSLADLPELTGGAD